MITVSISVNGEVVYARSARRQEADINPDGINTYQTDSGEIVEHFYGHGIIPLAKKILDTIKEDY